MRLVARSGNSPEKPEQESRRFLPNKRGMNIPQLESVKFEGWDCVRLSNGDAEVIATTSVGPRLIRYGLTDGPNAFQVIPASRGQVGGDEWLPYGGHRLWHAPEVKPRSYHPDNGPYGEPKFEDGTLRLVSPVESTTGVAKEIRVTLASSGSAVRVEHVLTNHNVWPITLSVWALSIVANGGRVVLPQEPFVSHDDELRPARPIILWPFTDMGDPRWRWGTKYLSLRETGEAGNPQKVGVYNARGWAAHLTDEQAFIIQIPVAPGGPAVLPDMGSNFETYTDGPFQELETLGPLTLLEPGQSASHVEHWFLAKTDPISDTDATLGVSLLPIVQEARTQRMQAFGN